MRILAINWAPIWRGAHVGGGVNGYLHHLLPSLARNGHEVTSLFGGLLHTDTPKGCFSRRHGDFHGVRVIEIINSPVLAPSAAQFREPMAEVRAPELEEEFARLLELLRPEVVHWHNIEGFSIGCVDRCKDAGARVVYSLHNYHTLCSQVTLCRGHEKPCLDFRSGHACSTCIKAPDPYSERVRRQAQYRGDQRTEIAAGEAQVAQSLAELKHELSWPKRLASKGVWALRARRRLRQIEMEAPAPSAPGRAIEGLEDLELAQEPRTVPLRVITDDSIDRAYAENGGSPLENVPRRDPTSGQLLGAHARRRAAMVEMLGRCDRVLAVSDFVRLKFEAEGVPAERLMTLRIGTTAADDEVSPRRPSRHGSHLRLLFLGYNHFNKGLPLLLAALKGMQGDALRGLGVAIFAPGVQSIGPEFRKLHPPLAELLIHDTYSHEDLPRIVRGHDLCYVGSTWWDPLPQTALESLAFGTPVLGAEAGGIPEAVRDGRDGFLFRANDPASLRSRLVDAIECFQTDAWPAWVRPPKSLDAHALELSALYAGMVHDDRAPRERRAETDPRPAQVKAQGRQTERAVL